MTKENQNYNFVDSGELAMTDFNNIIERKTSRVARFYRKVIGRNSRPVPLSWAGLDLTPSQI